jgi:hypothetical protein
MALAVYRVTDKTLLIQPYSTRFLVQATLKALGVPGTL